MLAQIDFDSLYEQFPEFKFGVPCNDPGCANQNTIGNMITLLMPYIFGAAGILLLLYLLWGGLQLMTSGGDPKAVQSARDKITSALIGFIIIFAAFWIVQIIGSFLGVGALREAF